MCVCVCANGMAQRNNRLEICRILIRQIQTRRRIGLSLCDGKQTCSRDTNQLRHLARNSCQIFPLLPLLLPLDTEKRARLRKRKRVRVQGREVQKCRFLWALLSSLQVHASQVSRSLGPGTCVQWFWLAKQSVRGAKIRDRRKYEVRRHRV